MLLSWPSSTSLNLFSRLLSWTSIVSTNFRSLWVRWSRTSMDWLMFWTWMTITYRPWLRFLAVFGNFSSLIRYNRSVLWLNCQAPSWSLFFSTHEHCAERCSDYGQQKSCLNIYYYYIYFCFLFYSYLGIAQIIALLYNWHGWHRSKYKHLPYYNAAVVHRLVDVLSMIARRCVLYLLQQDSELFGASVSGADRLLRSHDRTNTSTFSILSRTVHLPALLRGSRTHLLTANH